MSRGFLAGVGLPAFALSLGVTTVAGLLPVLLQAGAGPLVTGGILALEGVFALVVPPLVGGWADAPKRRLPLIAGSGLLAAAALVLMGFGGPVVVLAAWLVAFAVAYYAYLTPYYALFPELVDEEHRGRAQGSQGTWREVGLGVALIGGPSMLALWQPLPFLLAAAVFLAVTPLFGSIVARRREELDETPGGGSERFAFGAVRELIGDEPRLARFVAANALWESALAALRAFVVLFITIGLGRPETFVSLVLSVVAVAALIAAPLSGWLADRLGRHRVMTIALAVYATGMLVPGITQTPWVMPVVFVGAIAAASVMTLPYALLMDLLPEHHHGSAAALFAFSRGLGLLIGPAVAGLSIALLDGVLTETKGYAAIFFVASAALLASVPLLRGLDPEPGR